MVPLSFFLKIVEERVENMQEREGVVNSDMLPGHGGKMEERAGCTGPFCRIRLLGGGPLWKIDC